MINEENLEKLYTGILNTNELTTKELNGYGFTSKDLNDLIQNGSIERVKRGFYSLKDIDKLFYYGKKLIANKEHDKATLCFEKCYELNPNHLGACFQLFIRSIQDKNYERAFELYDKLSQSENEFYNIDLNFYLYLLSIITEVPEKNRDYARYLKLEDIRVLDNDKRYSNIQMQNKIRTAVLQRKFPYALKLLNDLTAKNGRLTIQDIVTKTLLLQVLNVETISKNLIADYINKKNYEEIVNHLLNKQQRHNLSIAEEYILKLTKQIIEIKTTSKVPCKDIVQTESLFEAIDAKNYDLAFKISADYNNNNNSIKMLLKDICSMINELNQKSSDEEVPVQEEKEPEPVIIEKKEAVQVPVSFYSVVSLLLKKDFENAFSNLKMYLHNIGKQEYEFLILDLIKISLLENDLAYSKPMIALTLISNGSYSFDISSYIQEFYLNLSQNNLEISRVYLDIISKSNQLGQECIITDGLLQILDVTEKTLNYKRNNSALGVIDSAIVGSNTNPIILQPKETVPAQEEKQPEPKVKHTIKEEIKQPAIERTPKVNNSSQFADSEREFLDKKYEELLKNEGIILLKPMDNDRINRIFGMVEEYPDMVASIIGEGNKRQVVLRYKPIIKEYIDVKNLINLGNQAYGVGNYDECINKYLKLLQLFSEPKAIVYSKLGLSFLKKKNIALAIDYLTIASELAKKEHSDINFEDLVLRLKKEIPKGDIKPRFKMEPKDFDYSDENNFYGIENFDEISSYIVNSGLSVETACQALNMTFEQIDIVRLIYAREYYIQGNYEMGDLFLKSVEKSKYKTTRTIKLFKEITTNKRFYQNRKVEGSRPLTLSLKP